MILDALKDKINVIFKLIGSFIAQFIIIITNLYNIHRWSEHLHVEMLDTARSGHSQVFSSILNKAVNEPSRSFYNH